MSAVVEWWVYCAAVAALLGVGAWALESALRGVGRSGRWAWSGALALSVLIPAVAWSGIFAWAPVTVLPQTGVLSLGPLVAAGTSSSAGMDWEQASRGAWIFLSALFAGWVVLSLARLTLARRNWRSIRVEGVRVLLTRDVGPAAVGVWQGAVVMPEWALRLRRALRDLLFLHEREHLRAGDPRLLLAGLVVVAAMPWNPVLWWQLRRLRLAVELDCDARVLRQRPDARTYGALLLEVGRRRGRSGLVVAFSEPVTFLERRIRMMTRTSKRDGKRAGALALAGLSFVFLAVCTETPDRTATDEPDAPRVDEQAAGDAAGLQPRVNVEIPPPPERLRGVDDAAPATLPPAPVGTTRQEIAQEPVFTPFTVEPKLTNQTEVEQALEQFYPPLLKEAGIDGRVVMWFLIDETGVVRVTRVNTSSGFEALDAAAGRVAQTMKFTPAQNRGTTTQVWVQIPITFTSKQLRTVAASRLPAAPSTGAAEDQPVFTPFTVEPKLVNLSDVERSLQRNYPPLLRDAGIGGRAVLWFHIDENGNVVKTQLNESSGYEALDDAAARVASTMRFTSAKNRDKAVQVWVQIPITFTSR
jgi:TonB family protein